MKTVGQAIRDMRQAKCWSMSELARRSGLHSSTVYRAEKGLRQTQPKTLEAVFAAFGPEALAAWREDPEFYKAPVRGLTWADPDEPLPSWLLWLEEKEENDG